VLDPPSFWQGIRHVACSEHRPENRGVCDGTADAVTTRVRICECGSRGGLRFQRQISLTLQVGRVGLAGALARFAERGRPQSHDTSRRTGGGLRRLRRECFCRKTAAGPPYPVRQSAASPRVCAAPLYAHAQPLLRSAARSFRLPVQLSSASGRVSG
jgi:hypothetical protein